MRQQYAGRKYFFFMMLCMGSVNVYSQKQLTLHANTVARVFQVTLPANPTTGYQWKITTYDKTKFLLKSQRYIRPESTLIGAGGETIFFFQLRDGQSYPRQTSMVFSYAQPWNASTATPKKVTVVFK